MANATSVHSHSKLILGGDGGALAAVAQKLLDKVGNVPTCDGDVLDRRADDIAFGLQGTVRRLDGALVN
jgi:hypothetical protein